MKITENTVGFMEWLDGEYEAFWFPADGSGIPRSLGIFKTDLAAGAAVWKAVIAENERFERNEDKLAVDRWSGEGGR